MKKEQLEALGLTEEQIKEIQKLSGAELSAFQAKVEGLDKQVGKLTADLAQRGEQLEALKKLDPEKLQKQIEELQGENKQKEAEYENSLKDHKLNAAIKLALNGTVHDLDYAMSLIDKGKLVIDGDKIIGIDEQTEKLKEAKGFLFTDNAGTDSGFNPKFGADGNKEPQGVDAAIAAAFGNTKE